MEIGKYGTKDNIYPLRGRGYEIPPRTTRRTRVRGRRLRFATLGIIFSACGGKN